MLVTSGLFPVGEAGFYAQPSPDASGGPSFLDLFAGATRKALPSNAFDDRAIWATYILWPIGRSKDVPASSKPGLLWAGCSNIGSTGQIGSENEEPDYPLDMDRGADVVPVREVRQPDASAQKYVGGLLLQCCDRTALRALYISP